MPSRACIRLSFTVLGPIMIGLSVTAASVAVRAETFFLEDGTIIEGTALRSLGNSLSIKLDGSGMHQLPLGDIGRVEIAVDGGGQVAGRLGWWANGAYGLVTEEGLIEVRDGKIVKIVAEAETPDPDLESEPTQDDAGRSAGQGAAAPAPAAESLNDERRLPKLEPIM